MHRVFTPTELNEHYMQCPKCNWKGKGSELKQEDLFLTDAIELFCPKCKNYMGFVSVEDGHPAHPPALPGGKGAQTEQS